MSNNIVYISNTLNQRLFIIVLQQLEVDKDDDDGKDDDVDKDDVDNDYDDVDNDGDDDDNEIGGDYVKL